MNKLNCFIKTSLLTCVVIGSQAHALEGYSSNSPPNALVKTHKIILSITNNTKFELSNPAAWFDSGRLGDGWFWPTEIPGNGAEAKVELYEKDNTLEGCSGYVNYTWHSGMITIAFSNPYWGTNKVGVGTEGKSVWEFMAKYGYKPYTKKFTVDGIKLKTVIKATAGDVNQATVVLTNDT
ncbi:MAG: hypothetical protein LPH19_12060 [Shewanella sp.]|nr:hypothetical protein [Shewanella sp.]MCF1431190.1 hypothetical protein [Shewanella sp.]